MTKKISSPLIAALALAACGSPSHTPKAADPKRPTLKVMTYNVNYGLSGDRETIDVIRELDSDAVFLQETNEGWERALRASLGETYPHMAFEHRGVAGGMAVLSRHPIVDSRVIEPPEGGWFPGWRVVIDSPIGRVQVLNVHLRPKVSDSGSVVSGYFTTDRYRLDAIKTYYRTLSQDLPTLVVGDFNEGADEDALQFLASRGLTNAKHAFAPGKATWRWKTSIGSVSSELDHIVFDPKLDPIDTWVVERGRSDHYPVVAVFQRR